ncbi:hypothetical protein [Pelagibius sp.]
MKGVEIPLLVSGALAEDRAQLENEECRNGSKEDNFYQAAVAHPFRNL